jgi:hypothetical protein
MGDCPSLIPAPTLPAAVLRAAAAACVWPTCVVAPKYAICSRMNGFFCGVVCACPMRPQATVCH